MKKIVLLAILGCLATWLIPTAGFSATKTSVDNACSACKNAGNKAAGTAVQSTQKKETSLIGMAYLNYIYQNDLTNPHFCQAMLLMNSQVPSGTSNPYVHLFDPGMGEKSLKVLEDVQLSFDYAIGRSNPPPAKLQASLHNIQNALKQ